MKKCALAIALIAACAFSVACGNSKDNQTTKTETSIETNADANAASDEASVTDTDSVSEDVPETQIETEEAVEETVAETEGTVLEDGVYSAKFDPDSGMFRVNEEYDDRGTLTVKDGKMTLHIVMRSENIVNLYLGLVEDAQNSDDLIEPTKEEVTYKDGKTETVNAFDVPVPYLDKEFDLALIGTKGKWYDHKVIVTDVEPIEEQQ